METWVTLAVSLGYLRVKGSAEQVSFADGDDGSIVERCQHLHLRPYLFNGGASNEECVEFLSRFSQYRHREISFKTFSLAAKRITTNANVHRGQQRLTRERIISLARQ